MDSRPTIHLRSAACEIQPTERDERRPRPSRALVPADIPRPEIGMMAWLAITGRGGMRCPTCGRFAREHDFTGAPSSAAFKVAGGVARVDFAPSCWRCRGLPEAPYAGTELVTPAYTLEPGASGGGG